MRGLRRGAASGARSPTRPYVFVGDGYSDRCAALGGRARLRARRARALLRRAAASRTSRSRRCTTLLLRFPEPYDFELSTGRFRAFGTDLANRLVDGALYRVVDGREVRIVACPGGVDVEPLDDDDAPGRPARCSARRSTCEPFDAWAGDDAVLAAARRAAARASGRRCSPTRSRRSSPRSRRSRSRSVAAVAIRNRLVERFGERARRGLGVPDPRADRRRRARHELVAVGFTRRKAEYVVGLARSDLDLDGLAGARRRRGARSAHRAPRPRPLDGRVVPRAPPRAPARVAGR